MSPFEGVIWCDMMAFELKLEFRKGKSVWLQKKNLAGRKRVGGGGGGDQIAKGLERQGEEFGLDSVGDGSLSSPLSGGRA